ncbi:M67 family metallopeptidase [Tenuibacillus multivorans]|uniref:Proteasome lid subunit RPN8/RPN11, contains Jab1/MPN metalloenzyme (JAMM) motif n=1 Tax=Tenuibacillus multivorans TaxID=237069 RepID=A0A1G9YMW9_9BACI|nr:M67 family metallopeptidase [Tenuibacillus multivorans]GEL78478.1 hypothetical protein TMU01_27130 [Tenuibacillus multivorans]SDN10440.1 Proteasome lid subunit RPN8/RPN11, contains Jab1/MPN metalloenzyme (JAMM) motif [Tenuibacillus multivorans]
MDPLILPNQCYQEIIVSTQSQLPYEACGFLSGTHDQIQSVWPLENQLQSNLRFFVDKKTVRSTIKQFEAVQEDLIAIYHSHPTSKPLPSYGDIKNHMSDQVLMMIVSYKYHEPSVKCFQILNQHYQECPIQFSS